MSPPANPLRQQFLRSLAADGVPLALVAQEPEVLGAQLGNVRAKALARIVTDLINQHEPMLRAECDGAAVSVCELGGKPILKIAITPEGKSS